MFKNHLCLIWSSFSGSLIITCTPIFILVFCRLKSRQAILALTTRFTMPVTQYIILKIQRTIKINYKNSYKTVWRGKNGPWTILLSGQKRLCHSSQTAVTTFFLAMVTVSHAYHCIHHQERHSSKFKWESNQKKSPTSSLFTLKIHEFQALWQTYLVNRLCSSLHTRWPRNSPSDCGHGLSAH